MAAGGVAIAGQSQFEELIHNSTVPVIVDFWASWCVPCRMIHPILEELVAEREGQLVVAMVNVDEHPTLAAEYGVMSIPTLLRFDGGQETARVVGAMPKPQLLKRLGL
ncbi:MAG: thioredoxin [Firmicutes bacterium]|nr:thioredoxin [Alicyclobacillaceae bacterium]MCL6496622.1 thioredoxin [Bacillota bacterium]